MASKWTLQSRPGFGSASPGIPFLDKEISFSHPYPYLDPRIQKKKVIPSISVLLCAGYIRRDVPDRELATLGYLPAYAQSRRRCKRLTSKGSTWTYFCILLHSVERKL